MKAAVLAWFWHGIEKLGLIATKPASRLLEELDFLAIVLASAGLVGRGQWRFLVRHTLQQIYFTAVQRAYMFTVVGLIISLSSA